MSCPNETNVAPFILGSLEPAERAAVAAHIEQCAHCRAVRDEFAALPGLMSRLTLEEATSGLARPDAAAYERLVRAANEERTLQRRRRWTLAVAALVLVAGVGTAIIIDPSSPPRDTRRAQQGPVSASATVSAIEAGSRLTLELKGVPAGQRCRLVAVDRSGNRDVAGSWVANYAGWAKITSTTSMTPQALDELLVETFNGQTLVTIPVADRS